MKSSTLNLIAWASIFTSIYAGSVLDTLLTSSTDIKSNLEKRTVGGIYICTDANWKGDCGYKVQPLAECIQLTSPWQWQLSSFGPDKGTICVVYNTGNCGINDPTPYNTATIVWPGIADLTSIGWNDAIGSFQCWGANSPTEECVPSVPDPHISCSYCCNGCDLSGTDCCPGDAFC
ncbi:hypothetical protein F5884DRAFT_757980 [Xylogone sp. PMI_703]|nr:hypothetical protein F5884DRAFT_757980 [Xylogone sp. PMI_703]